MDERNKQGLQRGTMTWIFRLSTARVVQRDGPEREKKGFRKAPLIRLSGYQDRCRRGKSMAAELSMKGETHSKVRVGDTNLIPRGMNATIE